MSAEARKGAGGTMGGDRKRPGISEVRLVATELHPGSKVDPHAATSARRRDTSGSRAPSGCVMAAAKLAAIPVPAFRL